MQAPPYGTGGASVIPLLSTAAIPEKHDTDPWKEFYPQKRRTAACEDQENLTRIGIVRRMKNGS